LFPVPLARPFPSASPFGDGSPTSITPLVGHGAMFKALENNNVERVSVLFERAHGTSAFFIFGRGLKIGDLAMARSRQSLAPCMAAFRFRWTSRLCLGAWVGYGRVSCQFEQRRSCKPR
jgi:hypothetical protein